MSRPKNEKVLVPRRWLEELEQAAAYGELEAFSRGEVTNPELMKLSGDVFRVVHWILAPDCRRNHMSWDPDKPGVKAGEEA